MIFASDLDRTLIYSSKFIEGVDANELVCVEYKGNKPISYMLKSATDKLVALSLNKSHNLIFIPTTTRSVSEFRRLNILNNIEYVITSNGGTILYRGEPLKEWEDLVDDKIKKHRALFDSIIAVVNTKRFVSQACIKVDNKFLLFKTNDKEACRVWLENVLDAQLWGFIIHGSKVRIIPKGLTKESAITFLAERLHQSYIVSAGDSKLDEGMLRVANECIIPKCSGIFKCSNIQECNPIVVSGGLKATNEILDYILSLKKHV